MGIARLLAIIAGVAALLLTPSQNFLDGYYANTFYPAAQTMLTGLTNHLTFAFSDCILVIVVVGLVARWILDLRAQRTWRTVMNLALHTLATLSVIYVWFMIDWGWNYDRPSLEAALHFDADSVERIALVPMELRAVRVLNDAAIAAHREREGNVDVRPQLIEAERATLVTLGITHSVVPTRPKRSIMDWYFTSAGVTGMFVPFTYETYLASDLLWYEYPFTLEHEWGHVAGIARESDANFIAALATLQSADPIVRYSGLLIVYGALPRIPRADARLSKLVLDDYGAMRRRDVQHIRPLAFKIAWGTYDTYLKAQHVPTGIVSYTEYIRLLLGTDAGRAALSTALGASLPLR
ncbi:MAG TPA: DUF3810 family protein [Candidatus Baltobacteraceae bacterium]|jgi:hypothetical protein